MQLISQLDFVEVEGLKKKKLTSKYDFFNLPDCGQTGILMLRNSGRGYGAGKNSTL